VLSDNADLNSIYTAKMTDDQLAAGGHQEMLEGITTYEEVIAVTG
jgi:hypothetical protein